MKTTNERLTIVKKHIEEKSFCIMIIGLGSVGAYLLDYLISLNDPIVRIVVVGRSYEKMETKVNIIRVGALIRERNKSEILIRSEVDLNDVKTIQEVIEEYRPDVIVNSSRAYTGLKYGSISWKHLRAYGIWSPLAIRFTKNIMQACENADTDAVVINTSYSDAVIPWLKSAGRAYPDFGSGNLNHLVPRIRYAVADMLNRKDYWNIRVMLAAGHFHDVCISKEGQTEGVTLPLAVYDREELLEVDQREVFAACKIPMPTDATRNMMNASSNYRIITAILEAVRSGDKQLFFSPGVFGELGGYPVRLQLQNDGMTAEIDQSVFTMEDMRKANKASMYLDGIEKIEDGLLYYTDELCEKVRNSFGVDLQKTVSFDYIDETAEFLIKEIILPNV